MTDAASSLPPTPPDGRWGALPEAWARWLAGALAYRVLPVVSNPLLPLDGSSNLPGRDRGKVPSMRTGRGTVVGITQWVTREFSDAERARWRADPDLGVCVRTGVAGQEAALLAFDIDVHVAEIVEDVLLAIEQITGEELAVRWRENSTKVLVPFWVAVPQGDHPWASRVAKRRWQVPGDGVGAIELLGDGQQFVAEGTHPSGARIRWRGPSQIPLLDAELAQAAWSELGRMLGATEARAGGRELTVGARRIEDADDAVLEALHDAGLVLDERAGKVFVRCPWAAEHSDGGAREDVTQTVYFPAGVGGIAERRWRCAHDHCMGRGVTDYLHAVGLWHVVEGEMLEAIPTLAPLVDEAASVAPEAGLDVETAVSEDGQIAMPAVYSQAVMEEAIVARADGNLLYVADRGAFALFDGRRWVVDRTGRGFDLARLTARRFARMALADEALGKGGKNTAQRLESAATVKGVAEMLRHDQRLATTLDTFDTDPWLINTPAGVYDARTGAMRPATREDRCMKSTAIAPDWSMPRPVFDAFLEQVTGADATLTGYLQMQLGYAMTGDTSLHALFAWYGRGRNGKSTLVDLVLRAAGEYAVKIPARTLMADMKGNRHPTEIATLMGRRLAVASEVEEGSYWAESTIKELTGDAQLSARFMRQDEFNFARTHKLTILCNQRPRLRSIDEAILHRIKMVPWLVSFAGREDRTLPERLWAEAPAIVAWLLDGSSAWYRERRMPACAAVDRATAEYFADQSTTQNWIDERCVLDPETSESISALYDDYRAWKAARYEEPKSLPNFAKDIGSKFVKFHANTGNRYRGLRLSPSREGVGL